MQKFIDTTLRLLSSAFAIELNGYLLKGGFDVLLSLLVALGVSTVMYKFLEYLLLEFPLHHAKLRRLLKPESRVEGIWISRPLYVQERPYSIVTIEYNPYAGEYFYSGTAHHADGTIAASWKSTSTKIDLQYDRLWFTFIARMIDEIGESVEGYGVANFSKDADGKYTRATGFFVNSGTNFIKSNFLMNRLEESDFQKLIGKKSMQTHEDLKALVKAYHAYLHNQHGDRQEPNV